MADVGRFHRLLKGGFQRNGVSRRDAPSRRSSAPPFSGALPDARSRRHPISSPADRDPLQLRALVYIYEIRNSPLLPYTQQVALAASSSIINVN